jgi:hypothetical protein
MSRMKNLKFLIILLGAFECKSQVIIPNATQQPSWVFPIYIEDALGQKDSVYYGYDRHSDPCWGSTCPERKFGEGFLPVYSNIMQAAIDYVSFTGGMDSLYKVDIRDSFEFASLASGSFNLFVQNAYGPIKLSYRNQLLYSDSLPFPSQANLPKAQVAVDCFYANNYINNCSGLQLLITDTSITNFCNFPDSVSVISFASNPTYFQFTFRFEPWNGISHTGIKNFQGADNLLKIFPNPSRNKITVKSTNKVESFELKNILGETVSLRRLDNVLIFELNLSEIPVGVYSLTIRTKEGFTITNQIIKQ